MQKSPVTIQRGIANRLEAAADVLTKAFADDPLLTVMAPSVKPLREMFRLSLLYSHDAANVDLALLQDQVVGVAVWNKPGYLPSPSQQHIGDSERQALLGDYLPRIHSINAELDIHVPADAWYLSAIGTVDHGKGIGAALLRDRLNRICESAYLESSKESNIAIYEHFGFKLLNRLDLSCGLPVWRMQRPGRSQATC